MCRWGFAVCALLSASAWAQTVKVQDAWVRATVSTTGTAAYMTLQSSGDAALVQVSTPAASIVEIHEMTLKGDVMRMRVVDRLPLPSGQSVNFRPGGLHVMLMDLKSPLKAGSNIVLTLVLEGAGGQLVRQTVPAQVRALNAKSAGDD